MDFEPVSPGDRNLGLDNYRLTYRYRIQDNGKFRTEIGGILFVRDAKITLRSSLISDMDDDLVVVTLLSGGGKPSCAKICTSV